VKKTLAEKYEFVKELHGEIHSFYTQLQKLSIDSAQLQRLEALISCIRNCMYAAKSSKDAQHDVAQLENSSNDIKYNFYLETRDRIKKYCHALLAVLHAKPNKSDFDELVTVYNDITNGYTATLEQLYREGVSDKVNEIEITTLINFNREAFTSCKALAFGIKEYVLKHDEAAYFDDLPGFIR
jgi:phosphate:Na+ symporter